MTAPAFIYTSEPWAARSFGRPIFAPAFTRERLGPCHPSQCSFPDIQGGSFALVLLLFALHRRVLWILALTSNGPSLLRWYNLSPISIPHGISGIPID